MAKWNREQIKRGVKDFLGIVLGTLLMAVALHFFLIPHRLAAGGVSGLGVLFYHLFNIPVGLTIIAVNTPIFIASYFMLGRRLVLQSILGAVLLSALVELLAYYFPMVVTDDLLLASVYGGVIMGIGLGLVFRSRGSTGGTALLSLILNKLLGLTPGQGLFGSDLVVIALALFAFSGEVAMYAALSLFISSWVIDVVQEGLNLNKSILVITTQGEEINRRILQSLDRGVTRIDGRGGYTGGRKEVLLCVVTRPQVTELIAMVREVDPGAFIVVGSAGEVYGEGFRRLVAGPERRE
ncbi:MAG TPA: YitT family protein [Bacillota bacterium]|jgi:uncharacterized membrane-anchored protein YitT (DUF2179 family)|nr:YitT family protein [Bacillota bacterium]HOB86369.1 YitT family protein [Bacillota bacterium]HOP68178.1 YitT family protein [Bacillota bacterium]HPT33048.1 YitT family protein [Bacillota bacterium]HPZ64193.1 YitT family protein [Bacillota bacterium]